MKECISCRRPTTNDRKSISMNCPACNSEIVRCGQCRDTAIVYKCTKCGFEGP